MKRNGAGNATCISQQFVLTKFYNLFPNLVVMQHLTKINKRVWLKEHQKHNIMHFGCL